MQRIQIALMYALCVLLIVGAAAIFLGRGNPFGALLLVPAALIWSRRPRRALTIPKALSSAWKPLPDNPAAPGPKDKRLNDVVKG